MTRIYQIIVISLLSLILLGGYFMYSGLIVMPEEMGSVNVTHEYQSTSTGAMDGGAVEKSAEFDQLIASSTHGTVVLGSIVVASTSAASMDVYNATSSGGFANGDYALVARFPTTTPQGTYTFDTELNYGLFVRLQAEFSGDYIFTYRR